MLSNPMLDPVRFRPVSDELQPLPVTESHERRGGIGRLSSNPRYLASPRPYLRLSASLRIIRARNSASVMHA